MDITIPGGYYYRQVGDDMFEPINADGASLGAPVKGKDRDKAREKYAESFMTPEQKAKAKKKPSESLPASLTGIEEPAGDEK